MAKQLIERQLLKVLYSPVKAFEKIVKKPDVKGPLLVFVLTLLATAGMQYVLASKILLETDGGTAPLLATDMFSGTLISYLVSAAITFFFNWSIYAVILLIILRVFSEEAGSGKTLFVVIGYAFVATTIQVLVTTLLFLALPAVKLPVQVWPPQTEGQMEAVTQIFREEWYSNWAFQLEAYLSIAFYVWTAVLCAIAIRSLCELTWRRAAVISAIASIICFFLSSMIL